MLELISFYLSGFEDSGRYETRYTRPKKILTSALWLLFLVYMAIYNAYLILVLVWCMLGAILNPQKFLPAATGTLTFVVFVVARYTQLKKLNDTLQEKVTYMSNRLGC